MSFLYVGIGGACGALARLFLGTLVAGSAGTALPWGTYTVNVLGSALLGWLQRRLPRLGASPDLRALLTVGLCGGFTTFSTFSFETLALMRDGRLLSAGAYALASVISCLAAVIAGFRLATWRERRGAARTGR